METSSTTSSSPRPQRRRIERLTYVDFGANNGGILLDVSEGGLKCQLFGGLTEGQPYQVRFTLPGTKAAIESKARVAWLNDSKRGGGLQFLNLSADDLRQLKEWISTEEPTSTSVSASIPIPLANATAEPNPSNALPPAAPDEEHPSEPFAVVAAAVAPAASSSASAPPAASAPATARIEVAGYPAEPAAATAQPTQATLPRPTPVRARSFASPAVQKHEVVAPKTKNSAKLRPGIVIGAFLFGVLATQVERVADLAGRKSLASATSASTTHSAPAAPFQVEVIDVTGRRWVIDNNGSAPKPVRGTTPALTAKAPAENSERLPGPSPPVTLQRPIAPQADLRAADPRAQIAPSIAEAAPPPAIENDLREVARTPSVVPAAPALADGSFNLGNGLPEISRPSPTPGAKTSEDLQPPKLVSSPPPVYPSVARLEHRQGLVVIDALVDATGKVTDMRVISGPPSLTGAAMQALRSWKYQPARLNGQPVATHLNVSINFSLR